MKSRIVAFGTAATLFGIVAVAGCSAGGREEGMEEEVIEAATPKTLEAPPPKVEREFWLAIAEEPGWHLERARESYLAGDTRGASADLTKVASMLKFESRHSFSQEEAGPLLLAVESLREVAKLIRTTEVVEPWTPDTRALDRVSAQTYRALGAHHLVLARESLGTGDALMAGRYIQETVNDIGRGFAMAGIDPGAVMEKDLSDAQLLAGRLVWEGDGDRADAAAALGRLADAMNGLGEVLGSRRK